MQNKLKDVRKAKNLTQRDVANLIGRCKSYYSNLENGHREPSFETLCRLSKALDVEVTDLFPTQEVEKQ